MTTSVALQTDFHTLSESPIVALKSRCTIRTNNISGQERTILYLRIFPIIVMEYSFMYENHP
jgi:hypothetical protein